jgi:hypothetical protein
MMQPLILKTEGEERDEGEERRQGSGVTGQEEEKTRRGG